MKVVILAGGLGTRLSEETLNRPKPLIEIGGRPIIWHIMKIYSYYGFNDFIVCLGYKGEMIKQYFKEYFLLSSDININLKNGEIDYLNNNAEDWKISLIDTGRDTMTGGRILRLQKYLDSTFMLTYGDGVGNINIDALIKSHNSRKKIATVTAVKPPGRFGSLTLDENDQVESFDEKITGDGFWINGGFFIFEPEIFNYLDDDKTILEEKPLSKISNDKELNAFKHAGFWRPMDTLRDKLNLEDQWQKGKAEWKIWD